MSYGLWAWAWADDSTRGDPGEIIRVCSALSTEVPSSRYMASRTDELVTANDSPPPATKSFQLSAIKSVEDYLESCAAVLGLVRSQAGGVYAYVTGLKSDIEPLSAELGKLFAQEGLTLFDPQKVEFVPPSCPKSFLLESSTATVFDPSWLEVEHAVRSLDGDVHVFVSLENKVGEYAQAAGNQNALTVEWFSGGSLAVGGGSGKSELVQFEATGSWVEEREILTSAAALQIFRALFDGATRPKALRWRDTVVQ